MELKTVQTHHVPVRYYEGGEGPALVFLHGAGGVTADDPLLAALAKTHRVYAPLVPGYGDSDECPEIRDMLDFTLHAWDVVAALALKDPILVGHSMGGMIAAEMAAYEAARPVFATYCAECHTTGSGKPSKKRKEALKHFSMDQYPFTGHHVGEKLATIGGDVNQGGRRGGSGPRADGRSHHGGRARRFRQGAVAAGKSALGSPECGDDAPCRRQRRAGIVAADERPRARQHAPLSFGGAAPARCQETRRNARRFWEPRDLSS